MIDSRSTFDLDVYKLTIEQLETSVFITNRQGGIIYVNPYFERNTGYNSDEILGQNPRILQSGEHSVEYYQDLWGKITNGETWRGELRNRRKDGTTFWSKVSISPIKDSDGVIQFYVAIEQDITHEKVQLEKAVRRESLLNDIQHLSKTGGWVYNVNSAKMFWTDQMYKLHGFKDKKKVDKIPDSLACYHHEDRKKVIRAFRELLTEGISYDLTIRCTDKLGNKKWLRTRSRGIKDHTGKVVKVIGSIMDVTDELTIKESLLSAYKERGLLLAEVHHRVKNNLALISGLLQLQAMTEIGSESERILDKSINRVNSIAFIYEQLYQAENFAEISLTRNIKRHIDVLSRTYDAGSRINIDLKLQEVKLNINQGLPLGLLINEILSNSFKYAFPGDETGTITVELNSEGNKVNLFIADNGIGMTKEQYEDENSVGHSIIQTLFLQIDAKASIQIYNGVSYDIIFEKNSKSGPAAKKQDFPSEKEFFTDLKAG